ncbi:MAG: aminotransferase class V-fold PLP-dependent enzyme, partial [Nitriliruptoraceae bacterium]
MDPRYLDVASRWPLRPEAATAWNDAVALDLGDPTRHHRPGRRAAELLDRATATVATTFGVKPERIVWTSGGTEAVHLAVAGTVAAADHAGDRRSQIVVSAVEHSSVLEAAQRVAAASSRTVTTIGVDHAGRIDVDAARAAISSDTLAVHVQHANHEVGTLQPVHEIARIAHDAGALVHVDACQTAGQVGFTLAQLDADLISASAAKFGGCAGVGVLALGDRARILPQFVGDDRQHHRRAGMLDTAALAASAV